MQPWSIKHDMHSYAVDCDTRSGRMTLISRCTTASIPSCERCGDSVCQHRSNFGTPDNWSSDSTFGLIFYGEQAPTGILGSGNNGSGRNIQLKAELRF
jgi:hypothetical protein